MVVSSVKFYRAAFFVNKTDANILMKTLLLSIQPQNKMLPQEMILQSKALEREM